jgi:hypothetical protein
MDSLSKLKLEIQKTLDADHLDSDFKTNMISSDIRYWCSEFLRLHQNIEETSISNAHKIERKDKLINQILDK